MSTSFFEEVKNWAHGNRVPKVKVIKDCRMEIDFNRGNIYVMHEGKVILKVQRVSSLDMQQPTVEVIAEKRTRGRE